MLVDSEEQRQLLLEIIGNGTFTGNVLESAFRLKIAVINAKIESPIVKMEDKG